MERKYTETEMINSNHGSNYSGEKKNSEFTSRRKREKTKDRWLQWFKRIQQCVVAKIQSNKIAITESETIYNCHGYNLKH